MEFAKLGNRDIEVSRICLGCMGFGDPINGQHSWTLPEEPSREMENLCLEDNIAMTPYSSLASGRLSRRPEEQSKRLAEDSYAHLKYDKTEKEDALIIKRVEEVADAHGVSMSEVALAWLLTRVTAPVVGVTKLRHVDTAVNAVNLELSPEEIAYLEAPYVPHALVGVMAQNTAKAASEAHVWDRETPK